MEVVTKELIWQAQMLGACEKLPEEGEEIYSLQQSDLIWAEDKGMESEKSPLFALANAGYGYGDGYGAGAGYGDGYGDGAGAGLTLINWPGFN